MRPCGPEAKCVLDARRGEGLLVENQVERDVAMLCTHNLCVHIHLAQHVLQATYHSNDMPCNHEIGCRIQPFARAMEIATAAIMFEEVPRFAHEGAMRAYYLLATVPARVWQGPHAPIRTRARHARTRARALPWRLRREVTRDTFAGILTETSPSNTPKRENTLNTT